MLYGNLSRLRLFLFLWYFWSLKSISALNHLGHTCHCVVLSKLRHLFWSPGIPCLLWAFLSGWSRNRKLFKKWNKLLSERTEPTEGDKETLGTQSQGGRRKASWSNSSWKSRKRACTLVNGLPPACRARTTISNNDNNHGPVSRLPKPVFYGVIAPGCKNNTVRWENSFTNKKKSSVQGNGLESQGCGGTARISTHVLSNLPSCIDPTEHQQIVV